MWPKIITDLRSVFQEGSNNLDQIVIDDLSAPMWKRFQTFLNDNAKLLAHLARTSHASENRKA
jgi:hypothetical protein